MGGSSNGRGGGLGQRPRVPTRPRSSGGWREGCRLVWRAHCPAGREGGVSSERDRRVRRGLKQDAVVYNEPGRRVTSLGGEQGDGGDPFTGGPTKWEPVMGRLCTQRLLYQTREAFLHASRRTERRCQRHLPILAGSRTCLAGVIRWDTGHYTRQRASRRAYRSVSPTASGCGTERNESSQPADKSAQVAGGCAVERSEAA